MSIKDYLTKNQPLLKAPIAAVQRWNLLILFCQLSKRRTIYTEHDFSLDQILQNSDQQSCIIKRQWKVYNDYPYDGSRNEKLQFELSSSYLDRWF